MKSVIQILLLLFILLSLCCQNKTEEMSHLYDESESLDNPLKVNSDAIQNLKILLAKEKFGPEQQNLDKLQLEYVGLLPPESRPLANNLLNESILRLIQILKNEDNVTQRAILNEFERGLNSLEDVAVDTEDRERLCLYYQDIMFIIGLKSTNDLLNNWMY